MTLKQYDWKDGPDLIQQHSVAKHRILEAYLAAYFKTLVSSPSQDVLPLNFVDGFAGGGLYVHNDTREPVKGSPFIFLGATREQGVARRTRSSTTTRFCRRSSGRCSSINLAEATPLPND
ncbi:MAG: three-Cys-motif partner protein TcmP [Burkholderiales bacterium]|nr:three-Cys-motif partner protein TcmP [Burkholderiales bacterium]